MSTEEDLRDFLSEKLKLKDVIKTEEAAYLDLDEYTQKKMWFY